MKICKSVAVVLICLLIAVSASFTGFAASVVSLDSVKSAVEGVISYKCKSAGAGSTDELLDSLSLQAGDYSSDWYYIALSQYGVDCRNSKSVSALKSAVKGFYSGELSSVKVTDMQRAAFALLSCGEDIKSVEGHNLLADCTYNRSKDKPLDSQGVNSVAYALLLLDSGDFSVPENAGTSRDDMIKLILDKELEGGGFALFGSSADIDITTIVLQALAPYKGKSGVSKAVEKSLSILSTRQTSDGAYKSFANKACAESTAQVVLALAANGIDPTSDSRFTKNGNSVMDGLLSFRLENGAFSHFAGEGANNIATYQSLCALVSCYRYLSGSKFFYDFKSRSTANTSEVDKAIAEHKNNFYGDSANSSKSKTSSKAKKKTKTKTKNKEQKETAATESTAALRSITDSSKIVFSKVVKSKKNKEKASSSEKSTDSVLTSSATGDEAATKAKAAEKSVYSNTQLITFAVIFLGYPALVFFKLRRKK